MSGLWQPLTVVQVVEVFGDASFRWWVSGGVALELHTGHSWRTHDDIDVGIVRADAPKVHDLVRDWEFCIASAGVLRRWRGEPLRLDRNENNLWCRRQGSERWAIDITVGEGDEQRWVFRRDASVTVPWGDAVLRGDSGVPYLAPEIQLLFKSRDPRPKDDLDARMVIPMLDERRSGRLGSWLRHDHPWQGLIVRGE